MDKNIFTIERCFFMFIKTCKIFAEGKIFFTDVRGVSLLPINPFKPNEISHYYQLDDSIAYFMLLGGILHFYLNFK